MKQYISQRFDSLGLTLSESDLCDMGLFDADTTDLTAENQLEVYEAFISFIPQILVRPASVKEGGYSINKASSEEIKSFYAIECKRLGIKNQLSPKIRII